AAIRQSIAMSLSCVYADDLVIFFFQAEDGIRDWSVTGVQTCALPIYLPLCPPLRRQELGRVLRTLGGRRHLGGSGRNALRGQGRSEERRVGKECRSRGSPYP